MSAHQEDVKGLTYLVCYFCFPWCLFSANVSLSDAERAGGREAAWGNCDMEGSWILQAKSELSCNPANWNPKPFPVLESLPFPAAKGSAGGDGIADKAKRALQLL